MPKLIENAREQLLAEARRQIGERGYASTTVRSVARACGVAVGTVYNYFPSKEMLVASYMAEDWADCLSGLRAQSPDDPEAYLRSVCQALRGFTEQNRALFADADAAKAVSPVFPGRHRQLRAQLAELAAPVFPDVPGAEPGFPASFAAEALLTWTVAGEPFSNLWAVLRGLAKKQESNLNTAKENGNEQL